MFVFPICFVDISKVKGFKDCKDSLLCRKVQEEVSHWKCHVCQQQCALKLYLVDSFIPVVPSFVLSFLLKSPFLLQPWVFLSVSLLRRH